MKYRNDRYGNPISVLGYGCMRFTQTLGGPDYKKAEKEVLTAIEAGVNYFDTAYIYPGSEATLGKIIETHNQRERINIATKLPHYLLKKTGDIDKYFDEQLKRLRTDYVDYYLMHMLTDVVTWNRLIDLGILDWLEEKKKSGAIRQIGFSYHGNSDSFLGLLEVYDWDFCMIQYNYLDEHSQAGVTGLKAANEKGIPVMIMEPLRGGRLVRNLPKDAKRAMDKAPVKRSPAEWSFGWLWNQPEVTCVLSGMNSMDMIRENVKAAEKVEAGYFTDKDHEVIDKVKEAINSKMKVGCTGCRYCMPCPKGVDIPGIFAAYNRSYTDSRLFGLVDYAICTAVRKNSTKASMCVKCGKCEQHCPQDIHIRDELENVCKRFEGPLFNVGTKVITSIMKQ